MYFTEVSLRQLIAAGESSTVEFKIKAPRPAELAERICGMVNSRSGGVIVLGVEDASGAIVGVAKPNDMIDLLLRAARMIRPPVTFAGGGPSVVTIDGVPLVVAQVPPNDGPLYQASGVFWQRRGTHTTPMTVEDIHVHLHASGALAWEHAICQHTTLADLGADLIGRYLNLRDEHSRINLRHMPHEEMLIRLKYAARDSDGHIRPTNVGMLLFGLDPQLYLPQSEVVCIRYADSLGVGKYQDR